MKLDRIKLITEMARKRMTVVEMAKITGISRVTITNVRSGKSCSAGVGYAIAKDLNKAPADLIETTED